MNRGVDSFNRTFILITGLLVLAVGVLMLLLGLGVFGDTLRNQNLNDGVVQHFIRDNSEWVWAAVAVVAFIVGCFALRWLLAQISTPSIGQVEIGNDRRNGKTTLASAAVADAVVDEVQGYRGVRSASAKVTGGAREPSLRLDVQALADADLPRLRQRLTTQAVGNARQALEEPGMPAVVTLKLAKDTGPRLA